MNTFLWWKLWFKRLSKFAVQNLAWVGSTIAYWKASSKALSSVLDSVDWCIFQIFDSSKSELGNAIKEVPIKYVFNVLKLLQALHRSTALLYIMERSKTNFFCFHNNKYFECAFFVYTESDVITFWNHLMIFLFWCKWHWPSSMDNLIWCILLPLC